MQNVIKKIKNKIKFLSWRLLYVLDFFTFSLPQVVISIIGTSLIVEFCETLFGEKPSLSFAQDVKVLWIENLFWVNYCTFVTSSTLFSFACKTASKPLRSKKLYFRIRFWHKTHLSIDESTWNWRENYFFNFISSMWKSDQAISRGKRPALYWSCWLNEAKSLMEIGGSSLFGLIQIHSLNCNTQLSKEALRVHKWISGLG